MEHCCRLPHCSPYSISMNIFWVSAAIFIFSNRRSKATLLCHAPFCILRDIAGMYSDAFKIWHIQKKRKGFLKPLGKIDDNLVLPRGNRGLALDFHRPHLVFQCVALELSID